MTARTPIPTNCDDVRDALAAYALGVLEPDERQVVELHLDTCARCRAELAPFERVTDSLALAPAPAPPPPDLRARLLAEAQVPRPVAGQEPTPPQGRPDRSVLILPRWVIWPAVAAAVLLIAAVAVLAVLLGQAQDDRDAAQSAGYQLAAYLSAGGRATKLSAVTTDGKYYGHGSLVTAPNLPPIVVVSGCSPTRNDRLYRVWVARGNDRTRVGELKVGDDGEGWIELATVEPLDTYDTVGITMVTGDNERQDVLVGQVVQTTTG
jgi:anti-sigma-K factor RskA